MLSYTSSPFVQASVGAGFHYFKSIPINADPILLVKAPAGGMTLKSIYVSAKVVVGDVALRIYRASMGTSTPLPISTGDTAVGDLQLNPFEEAAFFIDGSGHAYDFWITYYA